MVVARAAGSQCQWLMSEVAGGAAQGGCPKHTAPSVQPWLRFQLCGCFSGLSFLVFSSFPHAAVELLCDWGQLELFSVACSQDLAFAVLS